MGAFAKGLAGRGIKPTIFTSEHYPGEMAAQWSQLDDLDRKQDDSAGTTTGRSRKQTLPEMLVNFFVPMEPAWTLSLPNLRRVFKTFAENERPDVIFTTSHPLASAVGGMMLKRRYGPRLIVEFRDPWTQNPIRNWPTYLHFLVESYLERKVLRAADAVIMNTPTARSNLLAKYGWLDKDKVHVISHGFDGEAVKPIEKPDEINIEQNLEHVNLAYAGGFYGSSPAQGTVGQGKRWLLFGKVKSILSYSIWDNLGQNRGNSPETVLRAIAAHNADKSDDMPLIKMHFIGGNSDQVRHHINSLELDEDVAFYPYVDVHDLREVLQRYDFL